MNDRKFVEKNFNRHFKQVYRSINSLFNGKILPRADQPIAALQFAATFSNGVSTYDIQTLTMSNPKYLGILKSFFDQYGSILFSRDAREGREHFTPLTGNEQYYFREPMPRWGLHPNISEEKKASYSEWIRCLNRENFGKYSIWVSVTDKLSDPWTYSIDFFLVLNYDISKYIPRNSFIKQRRDASESRKWHVRENIIVVLYRFIQDYGIGLISKTLYQNAREQATRAAISQVMARNMSHNLGSHVLNNLTDSLLIETKANFYSTTYQSRELIEETETPIVAQLAIFNNYVKCRMDYLSDVTFGVPAMQTSKKVFAEVFKDLDRVRLLLEFISGLSDTFPFSIQFFLDDKPLAMNSDISVAMPNDLLGCQALYNILENIIRNTAKHNQRKDGPTVFIVNFKSELIIDPNEPEDLKALASSMFAVEISDDIEIKGPKRFLPSDEAIIKEHDLAVLPEDRYANPDRKNPMTNIEWLVYSQNQRLNRKALDENNKLRSSALGLLEMSASAAYLRKLDVIDIDENDFKIDHDHKPYNSFGNLNILKAFNNNGRLAYRFFIKKPTEFLFIGPHIHAGRREYLYHQGISIITRQDFEAKLRKGRPFHHLFLVYFANDRKIVTLIKRHKVMLPNRVMTVMPEKSTLVRYLNDPSIQFQEIERKIWRMWFDRTKGKYLDVKVGTNYDERVDKVNDFVFHIVLLNHYGYWNGLYPRWGKDFQYLEPLSSVAQRLLPEFSGRLDNYVINKVITNPQGETLRYKLFEAANSKVLVIDERIQRFSSLSEKNKEADIPYKDIFKATNVMIPLIEEVDLYEKNFDSLQIEKARQYVNNNIKKNDFMVIHYSILERMFESDIDRITKELRLWAGLIRVVVTSGRGKPSTLPDEVCYINLSPVLKAFTQTRNKYEINHLLHQARH